MAFKRHNNRSKFLLKHSLKMNFQYQPILKPLKVVFVNPLAPASQLVIWKILRGVIFGKNQLVDIILVTSSYEMKFVDALRLELESCAFPCSNSFKISLDLPSSSEGDVFCFMTDFTNPNCLKFNKENPEIEFKALNFMITLAKSFTWSYEKPELDKNYKHFEKKKSPHENIPVIERKPVVLADGLLAMDILKSLSMNMPNDSIFCPSPITTIAKTVIGDYLSVQCDVINDVLVWAANDEVFHVEVEKPLIINDFHCKSDIVGKDLLESLNLDSTQFNAAWMKKEFIEKVASSASKNPYGCIYRAAEFSKTLRDIWLTRIQDDVTKVYTNMGVISDGSLGTIKGYAYILPIVMRKDSWSIDRRFEDDTHLKMEIKRLNKMAKDQHIELISHCKNFLRENVIYQAFRDEDDSGSTSKY